MPGTLFVVATPIGNLEDITIRALATLKKVAIIAAEDTRHTAKLLTRYGITTPTTSLHEHNEQRKTPQLLERLTRGEDVALVSDAGTPTVSDPGGTLIGAAIERGIRVEPIPGPSATLAALVGSGLSTKTFSFLGFPPVKGRARGEWFTSLKTCSQTVIFFEAPHRIAQTLADLQAAVGDRRIALGRELTKTHEELVRGPISTVLAGLKGPLGEYTVVVDIGQTTDNTPLELPDGAALLDEIGRSTDSVRSSRRQLISEIARKYGRTPNEVYEAIEQARKSVD